MISTRCPRCLTKLEVCVADAEYFARCTKCSFYQQITSEEGAMLLGYTSQEVKRVANLQIPTGIEIGTFTVVCPQYCLQDDSVTDTYALIDSTGLIIVNSAFEIMKSIFKTNTRRVDQLNGGAFVSLARQLEANMQCLPPTWDNKDTYGQYYNNVAVAYSELADLARIFYSTILGDTTIVSGGNIGDEKLPDNWAVFRKGSVYTGTAHDILCQIRQE